MGSSNVAWVAACAVGFVLGLGGATFDYAEGTSYLRSDPAACANCHIMQSQLDSWERSSHRTAALCVDCHLPADPVGKYLAKAINGWNHSVAFTLQRFPEPIRITPRNAQILQQSCLRCHGGIAHALGSMPAPRGPGEGCMHCHADVGHGERAGLGGPLRAGETSVAGGSHE